MPFSNRVKNRIKKILRPVRKVRFYVRSQQKISKLEKDLRIPKTKRSFRPELVKERKKELARIHERLHDSSARMKTIRVELREHLEREGIPSLVLGTGPNTISDVILIYLTRHFHEMEMGAHFEERQALLQESESGKRSHQNRRIGWCIIRGNLRRFTLTLQWDHFMDFRAFREKYGQPPSHAQLGSFGERDGVEIRLNGTVGSTRVRSYMRAREDHKEAIRQNQEYFNKYRKG